jgi:hypothetical protein
MIRRQRAAVQARPDHVPSALLGLLHAVVVDLAEGLERPSPEAHRIVMMRLDVVADPSRLHRTLRLAHPTEGLARDLVLGNPLPSGGAIPEAGGSVLSTPGICLATSRMECVHGKASHDPIAGATPPNCDPSAIAIGSDRPAGSTGSSEQSR